MVAALEPLLAMLDYAQGVRLLGVHAQKLTGQSEGIPRLFDDGGETPEDIEEQWKPASKAVDQIVDRFGAGMIGQELLQIFLQWNCRQNVQCGGVRLMLQR